MLKHRNLLRSIILTNKEKEENRNCLENFNYIKNSNIVFQDVHSRLFLYIANKINKDFSVPSMDLMLVHFLEDKEALDELEVIKKDCLFLQGLDFRTLIREVYNEQQKIHLMTLLKETAILSDREGPHEAVRNFLVKSNKIVKPEMSNKSEGSLKEGIRESYIEYLERKKNQRLDGLLTGLETIDYTTHGVSPKELWLILAFAGELKTTLSQNFAYFQAIELKKYVQFVSLEMPREVVRDLFISIHSANFNLWASDKRWSGCWPLKFEDIEDGTLSPEQEKFYEFICEDFENNPDYGDINIYAPETEMTISLLKSWATVEYQKKPFDILYLDYIELMKDDMKYKDYTVALNQRIKDLKQFALHFNDGMGMRLVSAYQANRKGKELADKNNGEYRLDALSYANEAERSADVILYSYLNSDLRKKNQVKIGSLKGRKRGLFEQFTAFTHLATRKVYQPTQEMASFQAVEEMVNKQKKINIDDII